MAIAISAVLLSLAVVGLGVAVAFGVLALGARSHLTPAEGVPALPVLEDVRVVKARQVLDRLGSSGHVPVRAAAGFLRRQLASAAKRRAKLGAQGGGDASLGEGIDAPEEEQLRAVLVAVAGLSGLADAPESEDLSGPVDRLVASLNGKSPASSSQGAFQDRSAGSAGSTASGVW